MSRWPQPCWPWRRSSRWVRSLAVELLHTAPSGRHSCLAGTDGWHHPLSWCACNNTPDSFLTSPRSGTRGHSVECLPPRPPRGPHKPVPVSTPAAPPQAAPLTQENILLREGTYRAIGECFLHLRSKVGATCGGGGVRCWGQRLISRVGIARERSPGFPLPGARQQSVQHTVEGSFAGSNSTKAASGKELASKVRTLTPTATQQVDFNAWYASELRLILQSTELTGECRAAGKAAAEVCLHSVDNELMLPGSRYWPAGCAASWGGRAPAALAAPRLHVNRVQP